jgi:hypothetical protein
LPDRSDRDAQVAQRGRDAARLLAAGVGEVSLLRAVGVVRHLLVVLAEVGRRVAQVEDVAALAQRGQKGGPSRSGGAGWATATAAKAAIAIETKNCRRPIIFS